MKLLIVEDSELVAARLRETLAAIPQLAVAVAGSCAEARENLRSWQPQLVVLDIDLPDGNGLELLRRVKLDRPATCVLMFSNHMSFRRHCVERGADAFFDKAMEFEALADAVRALAGGGR